MENIKLNTKTLLLGIDIGWSPISKTCGVACYDPLARINWRQAGEKYSGERGFLYCCRFRLADLVNFLDFNRTAIQSYDNTVIVLDGPIGPRGKPTINRNVDKAFVGGGFHNRVQPSNIESKDGNTYVDATYSVIESIDPNLAVWVSPWDRDKLVITETHPTIGLALMNKKFDRDNIPSRKRPLMPPNSLRTDSARALRAKSDFYWRSGGNSHCARLLDCKSVAHERNHELVAGLYCLSVAVSINDDVALIVGDANSGYYCFPNEIHPDWHSDLNTVGIIHGEMQRVNDYQAAEDFSAWTKAMTASQLESLSAELPTDSATDLEDDVEDDVDYSDGRRKVGDHDYLLLNDNGGVQQKHNPWLNGIIQYVRIEFIKTKIQATLRLAEGGAESGQWTIQDSEGNRANGIARVHGHDVPHLANDKSISIEFKILAIEC